MGFRTMVRRQVRWDSPLHRLAASLVALSLGLLLVRVPPLLGALLAALVIVVVATLIEPLVGLSIGLFLSLLRALLLTEAPQVPAQIGQVFVMLALAVWVARGLVRRDLRIAPSPLLVPLCLFISAALLSLWDPVELTGYGLPELLKWIQVLLVFLFVSDRLTVRRLPWLLASLLAIGVFQAGVGIWQFALRGEGPEHFAILDGRFFRAYGTFEQPNPYAGFLGLGLSLAVGLFAAMVQGSLAQGWRWRLRKRPLRFRPAGPRLHLVLVVGAAALIMLAALGMSWSRGAWMGMGAAALAMAVALPRKGGWRLLLVVALVIGGWGLYATGLLPASMTARLTDFAQYVRFEDVRGVGINDANYSVLERFAHWQAALEMFRYRFWTGVGFGDYEPAYGTFALINWPIALGHAHNYYLTVAAESGIIGLVAYSVLWAVAFWQTWRLTRRATGLERGIMIGLLGAWTHLSVHHMLDNLYVNNVHLQIGIMLGILAYLSQRRKVQNNAS